MSSSVERYFEATPSIITMKNQAYDYNIAFSTRTMMKNCNPFATLLVKNRLKANYLTSFMGIASDGGLFSIILKYDIRIVFDRAMATYHGY